MSFFLRNGMLTYWEWELIGMRFLWTERSKASEESYRIDRDKIKRHNFILEDAGKMMDFKCVLNSFLSIFIEFALKNAINWVFEYLR